MFGVLEALIAFFSLLAAASWVRSAAVRLSPKKVSGEEIGSFPVALQRQAKWNRLAATFAALAALSQFAEVALEHAQVGIGPLE